MEFLLLVLALANGLLFGYVGLRSLLLARSIPTPRARTQAYLLALVCAAFVVSVLLRIGLQLVDVGALSESVRESILDGVQLVTSLGALLIVLPAMWMLRDLTKAFAQTDRFVTVLTDRVVLDASVSEAGLTARELEVLETVAAGVVTDADLAEALFISPATAATHVRNIMRKTGVRRRHELILLAASGGDEVRR